MDKSVKLAACLGLALSGWLLPASLRLAKPLQGISLGFALTAALCGASEAKRDNVRQRFAKNEHSQELEYLATELTLKHEKRIQELYEALGFDLDDDRHDRHQEALTGGHIGQPTIAGGNGSGETDRLFRLEWLLQSNSQHALLCGDTGAGKTVLARWLLDQLDIKDVEVLDPDDDQRTWQGFKTIGTDDDWEAIREAYGSALEEFNSRKPNDRSLTPKAFVLEELPDHLIECKNAEKVISRILRRGRKRRVFLLAITQDANQDAIKLSAPLKKCFSTFFLQGYAQHALRHLCPKADRAALAQGLKECKRPAIVQFKGEFFYWNIPDLSGPGGGSGGGNAPALPLEQSSPTISTLERTLSAPPIAATLLHWEVHDLALAVGGELSIREAMRRCSTIKNALEAKTLFRDLVSLELGEMKTDGNRTLFRAYPPIV